MGHIEIFKNKPNLFYDIRTRKKKNGKKRIIYAPSTELKKIQRKFADWFYNKKKKTFDQMPYITGFIPGRSILDNAKPHLGQEWVITIDIKDFFPQTNSQAIDNVLKEISSERTWFSKMIRPNSTGFKGLDSKTLIQLLCINEGLTQGSPASPILANYIAIDEIDMLVIPPIVSQGFAYTRYADDLTFSCDDRYDRGQVEEFTNWINKILEKGSIYKVNNRKIKIKHRSQRQEVTGIIVNNEKMGVSRERRNKLRAAIHQSRIKNTVLSDQDEGLLSFIQSVNPEQYNKLTNYRS